MFQHQHQMQLLVQLPWSWSPPSESLRLLSSSLTTALIVSTSSAETAGVVDSLGLASSGTTGPEAASFEVICGI